MADSTITDWISAIAAGVAALGVGFVAYQVFIARKQLQQGSESLQNAADSLELARQTFESDHERSRRQNAADLILQWSTNLKWEASLARKLVEKLSREETVNLYEQVPFEIDEKHLNMVAGCLTDSEESELITDGGKIKLTEKQSAHISWLVISYLNLLESILVYWQHGIADVDMIKAEFQYLVNHDTKRYILHDYRTAKPGVDNYPAIRAFVDMLKREHENSTTTRPPIGQQG